MYQRIVVPLDGSAQAERILPFVTSLANKIGTRVTLLLAIEPDSGDWAGIDQGLYRDRNIETQRVEAYDYLQKVQAGMSSLAVEIDRLVPNAKAADSIVFEAERSPDTLIAMSTHGRSGVARWALGSVADKVLHATSGPLLLIRADAALDVLQDPPIRTIIVPLDGSTVAEQAIPHAVGVAKMLDAAILLVRATPSALEYAAYTSGYPSVPAISYATLAGEAGAEAERYLLVVAEELRKQGVVDVTQRLLHGHPAGAIVDVARVVPHSMIAIASHGRSGIGRWVLGSIADRVVRHAEHPVLVVHASERGIPGSK